MQETYRNTYDFWSTSEKFDEQTRNELSSLIDEEEIFDRFYKEVEFGTGGARGIIGAGTNRINKYTISKITQGFGNYLIKNAEDVQEKGIVIAYDMRAGSKEFALIAANSLAKLGIRSFLFKEITPTPQLSFTVPFINASGGIVITASHNPPCYNGYKIYDETGCQAVPSITEQIVKEIQLIKEYDCTNPSLMEKQLITWIEEPVKQAFLDVVLTSIERMSNESNKTRKAKLLYTPLHGTGKQAIFKGLEKIGFKDVVTVPEQLSEDPEFKTVSSPNPEDIRAFDMAISVGKKNNCDLIIGTDPDCDRVGVLVKHEESYIPLTGNQLGCLMIVYIMETMGESILKKVNPYIVKTIVTTELGSKIAKFYGLKTYNTLTGFKYIGDKINSVGNKGYFVLGFEESYGYLAGTYARDKDGVGSALLIATMADYYLERNCTLMDVLNDIYKQFGYYKEELISITLDGENGRKKIDELMFEMRNLSDDKKFSMGIKSVDDYSQCIDGLPLANVLKINFEDESWVAVRPSGTEPKIKYYINAIGQDQSSVEERILELKKYFYI